MMTIKGIEGYAEAVEKASQTLAEEKERVLKELMQQGVDISKLVLEEQQIKYELIGGDNAVIKQLYRFVMKETSHNKAYQKESRRK